MKTKIGLFGIGLDTYWPQFKGLRERLVGYQDQIGKQIKRHAVELVDAPRVVGRGGAHLQFTVRQQNAYRKAIAFGQGAHAAHLAEHRHVRLAFEPLINEWNGQRKAELKVIDWKPVS